MLETLTREGGASGRRRDHETARHLVARRPHGVSGALESEHRVEHVERNQGFAVSRVRRTNVGKRGHCAGLVDTHVQDLALRAFLIGEQKFAVDRGVVLTVRVVDLGRREEGVDAEGASLVRDDRNDAVAKVLRSDQVL